MEKELFGTLPSGECVFCYMLKSREASVKILTRGAAVNSFKAFGTDIVMGFDNIDSYLADTSYQGAIIGRVANRIENSSFKLNGIVYNLPQNNGKNSLHGGVGFNEKIWTVKDCSESSITLEYISKDMEAGYPGELTVTVCYTLCGASLSIDYTARTNADTPIALTNHSYFNLNGSGGTILSHKAKIYAKNYTEVRRDLIPTGNRPDVIGTPFDFTDLHEIGERLSDDFRGYDHNFVLCPEIIRELCGKKLGLCATVYGERLAMNVYTDQPGVQFYIGNSLGKGPDFKGGVKQIRHGAFCLETQTEPNCVNHGEAIYTPKDVYRHTTVYEIYKK